MSNPLVTVDPGLYLWTIVTFLVLAWALRKFAWAPLLKALDERREMIAASVEDARRAKEQLARAQQDAADILARARVDAEALITRVRADAEAFRQDLRTKAAAEAAAITRDAERQIQREAAKAVEQLRQEAVALSVAIASKLIRREITAADHETLVNDALREIGRPPN